MELPPTSVLYFPACQEQVSLDWFAGAPRICSRHCSSGAPGFFHLLTRDWMNQQLGSFPKTQGKNSLGSKTKWLRRSICVRAEKPGHTNAQPLVDEENSPCATTRTVVAEPAGGIGG
jgi:hypothetical protein